MKRAYLLILPMALLLSACGAIRPLGYCSSDGLFYYSIGNGGPIQSATPQEVIDQGFDPYAYGEWCPSGAPTATPSNTQEPPTATPTPTDTLEPTPTETWEPTATDTVEPTATLPLPTATAQAERKPKIVIKRMWLLTEQITGNWCVILSDSHPSIERQAALCEWPWNASGGLDLLWEAMIFNAPCAGPVYDNDIWACDDESLEWRMSRWPDAQWLHGLGRDSLEVLCDNHPDYCGD